jgi:hypothetical protein
MAEVETEWCRGLSTEGRGKLASRGSRADPHYHIVATFEAKDSGAPGVLAQSLGISGRLERGCIARIQSTGKSRLARAKDQEHIFNYWTGVQI